MAVLIVMGTTVVVGTIIHRLYARESAPPPMLAPLTVPQAPMAPSPAVVAQLQLGEHIAGIAGAGADVAVWVSGSGGDRLLLLNPASGQWRVVLQGVPARQNDASGGLNKSAP